MKPRGLHAIFTSVLCFIGATIAGCAAGPGLKPDAGEPTGYVVASIGPRLVGPNAGTAQVMELIFRETSTGRWGSVMYDDRLLTSTSIAHSDPFAKVGVVAIPVRPGNYALESVSFQYPGGTVFRSKNRFSLPFSVGAGESVYLGEFLGHSTTTEGLLGASYTGGYFRRANRAQRDIALIRKAYPETAATRFIEADTKALRPPFIVR